MNAQAVVAYRPCGCLDEIYDPEHFNWQGTDELEALGFKCELMDGDDAEAIPYVECEHGSTQQQLAALVKKQAGEIAKMEGIMHEQARLLSEIVARNNTPMNDSLKPCPFVID